MLSYYYSAIFVLVVLYGLCIGSFLNVVIYRIPAGVKMTKARSFCPKCKNQLKWYDNIPIFSYIFLGGKCRYCRERISPRYPIVEASNCILWILSFVIFKENLAYAAVCSLASSVGICIFMIDLDTKMIYDRFQIMFAALGVAAVFLDKNTAWYSHLIGAAAGAAVFYLVGLAVSRAVGADALGFGDVKLCGAMGLFLGWEKLLFAVIIASLAGCVIMIIAQKRKKLENNHEFPFGPFLIAGFAISMLTGDAVISAYLGLLM